MDTPYNNQAKFLQNIWRVVRGLSIGVCDVRVLVVTADIQNTVLPRRHTSETSQLLLLYSNIQ